MPAPMHRPPWPCVRVDAGCTKPYHAASFCGLTLVRDRIAFVAVGLQALAVLVCGLGAWALGGWAEARFAWLGGAAAVVPNGLFAVRLALHRGQPAETYPTVFLSGELVKVLLSIALLALVGQSQAEIAWLAVLSGWIVALQAPMLLLPISWWQERRSASSKTVF